MLVMINEDQTNRALISALLASSSQFSVSGNKHIVSVLSTCIIKPYSTALIVLPPSIVAIAASVTDNPPTQATITTGVQAFPEINVKFQRILKR